MGTPRATHIDRLVSELPYPQAERAGLVELVSLFARLPPPPDPVGLYPDYARLRDVFVAAIEGSDAEALENSFVALYAHLHGYDVPYTTRERQRLAETHGYLNHVGGLSPILKAGPFIHSRTVSADFGAGNGLQCLLMQALYPHEKTVQIEISSRMVESGRELRAWLGIPEGRVEWVTGDVGDVSPDLMDFVYIYRPVRPTGAGRQFYERFARTLCASDRDLVVFSIADCLRDFIGPELEVFYHDGHLTCFRRVRGNAP
jgi:hypothetical protein